MEQGNEAANENYNTQKVPDTKTSQGPVALLGPPAATKPLKTYAAAIVIVVVMLAIVFTAISLNFIHLTTSTTSTTSAPPPASTTIYSNPNYTAHINRIQSFLNTASLPVGPTYYVLNPYLQPIPECNFSGWEKWYIENGFSDNSALYQNYSKLNQSIPFAWEVIIGFSNTTKAYNATINGNGGYCSSIIHNVTLLSSFTSSKQRFYNNATGYLVTFTNFTSAGLNLTNSYYIGPKPNLEWSFSMVNYNGIWIRVAAWGFYNEINESQLINWTNITAMLYSTS